MSLYFDLPKPSNVALLRSKTLTDTIRQAIDAAGGAIPFSVYMDAALNHPQLGYYNQNDFSIGRSGDFITAPHVSPLFAHGFANQFMAIKNEIAAKNILEIGAGDGTFARDLLQILATKNALPAEFFIVEKNLSLIKKQQRLLRDHAANLAIKITWLTTFPEEFAGIVIGNEVLDALPVDRFMISDDGIFEAQVSYQTDEFIWQKCPFTNTNTLQKILQLKADYGFHAPYISELQSARTAFIDDISRKLKQGILFFFDYGYGAAEYYHPERKNGTFTAFYQHHHHTDPFFYPGLSDLTAHVNFTDVIEMAAQNGCDLLGYSTQASFLLASDMLKDAECEALHLSPKEAFAMHQAIKILTFPTEMGERIKVMAIGKNVPDTMNLIGFSMQDRRRDL